MSCIPYLIFCITSGGRLGVFDQSARSLLSLYLTPFSHCLVQSFLTISTDIAVDIKDTWDPARRPPIAIVYDLDIFTCLQDIMSRSLVASLPRGDAPSHAPSVERTRAGRQKKKVKSIFLAFFSPSFLLFLRVRKRNLNNIIMLELLMWIWNQRRPVKIVPTYLLRYVYLFVCRYYR